jgi:hypothetical protein
MRLRLTLPVALRLSTYGAFRKKSTADNSPLVETAASRTASFKNGTTNRRERFADRKTKVDVPRSLAAFRERWLAAVR